MSPARRILGLLTLTLLVTVAAAMCTSSNTYQEHETGKTLRLYRIVNNNWNQATVSFYCNGHRTKLERDISTGETREDVLRAADCVRAEFIITFLGSPEVHRSGDLVGWAPGTWLVIRIENHLPLTNYTLRAA